MWGKIHIHMETGADQRHPLHDSVPQAPSEQASLKRAQLIGIGGPRFFDPAHEHRPLSIVIKFFFEGVDGIAILGWFHFDDEDVVLRVR